MMKSNLPNMFIYSLAATRWNGATAPSVKEDQWWSPDSPWLLMMGRYGIRPDNATRQQQPDHPTSVRLKGHSVTEFLTA